LGFPDSFENAGNPNKKYVSLLFGFRCFLFGPLDPIKLSLSILFDRKAQLLNGT
jgi:hypothetical protein